MFINIADKLTMECDFKTLLKQKEIVTKIHDIDPVGHPIGISFEYSDKKGLEHMIETGRCYQTIEQLCQPWLHLLYTMDDSGVQAKNSVNWSWYHIHPCICLRYNITLHTNSFNTTDR